MIRFVCKKSLHWTDWMSTLKSFIWFCLNFHLTNWMVEHNRCITRKERKKAILIFRKYTDIPLPDARLGPGTLHLRQSIWDCRNLSRHTWVVIQIIIMDCEQIRRNFKSKEDFGMLCQWLLSEAGLQKSFDVLQFRADPGSCSPTTRGVCSSQKLILFIKHYL